MRIGLLGPLDVRAADGTPVEVGGARLRTLVTLLALEPGRTVTAARLADGVWGDTPPGGAGNALQSLISRLRRALPDGVLQARPTGYLLAVAPQDVDHLRFEALVGQARAAADPAAKAELLAAAERLWRGPALADAGDAPFARGPRARLDELRLAAAEDRLEARLAIGLAAGADVVAELEAMVAEHPLRERAVALLMRALRGAGRTGDALAAFERCRVRLAEELGADPSAPLAELHLALLRSGEPAVEPPAAVGNLRAPLTSFVGRDREVAAVGELVGDARLVTLAGPGGAGKTRLAVEAGRALRHPPPDGVWLVELAPVTDPVEIVPAVWSALGLRDPASATSAGRRMPAPDEDAPDAVARLGNALAYRKLLLVLDNCEHVVEAAAVLAERLLGDCPHLHVLATSREPLGITGEVLFGVEPLPLPPPLADVPTAARFPSVRLFKDRAAAVRPSFVLDDATVDAVVRICRALDGMPLAIELAAARCRSLAPAQIADRLDNRFRLLTRGSRTALPRHQTLRGVVDWSWELLDDAERTMLRRLAVFPGGATPESAAAVCDPGGELGDPLDLLTALTEKSLLTVDDAGRYRMLETIRAYGLERLEEHGEAAALRDRHGAWFLALVERLEGTLRGRDQLASLALLSVEHDNLHGAVRRAVADGNADLAVRFIAAIGWYWWLAGHRVEGAALAGAALSLPGSTDAEARAMACGVAAVNGFDGLGDTAMLNEWFQEALRFPGTHPMFRLFRAVAALFQEGPQPETLARLVALTDDEDPWIASIGLLLVGHTLMNVGGRFDAAVAKFEEALAGFRGIGERWGMAFALSALAEVVARQGRHQVAVGHFEEALTLLRDLGATEDRPVTEIRLAQEYLLLGEVERADAMFAEARRTAHRAGVPDSIAFVEYAYAERALRAGDLDEARSRFVQVRLLIGNHRVSPQMQAMVHSGRALVHAHDGEFAAARAATRTAIGYGRGAFDAPVVALVLSNAGEAALIEGDAARAVLLFTAAQTIIGGGDCTRPWTDDVETEARTALDDETLAAAVARGRAATIDNLLDLLD